MAPVLNSPPPRVKRGATRPADARPIVKWVGGKRQLLDELLSRMPARWNRYFEPFAGGAALFFQLEPAPAFLYDRNEELVRTYAAVRDRLPELAALLSGYPHDREFFYRIRALDPRTMTDVEAAARFLYLNRTCFNGLYRVNSKGQFNVPFGRYANPRICDVPRLEAAAAALRETALASGDFELALAEAQSGDFLYFDPPYVPLPSAKSFTAYTACDFGDGDQQRLAAAFAALDRRGCRVMLSNSDTPRVRELYAGFRIDRVTAARKVNSRVDGRGPVDEVIVRNYS